MDKPIKELRSINIFFWREDDLTMNTRVCEIPISLPQYESLVLVTSSLMPRRFRPVSNGKTKYVGTVSVMTAKVDATTIHYYTCFQDSEAAAKLARNELLAKLPRGVFVP